VSFGMFGVFFFLTLFLQNIQGYSALGMGVRSLPLTGAIIITAPLAGQVAGRIGPRIPMAVGLGIVGTGMLLMERITPGMPYSQLWWNLLMLGVGMGLVMTPMTAAVMGSVPRRRAGMASATSNASRELGGVFGIALLGAVVTHWFAKDLRSSLAALPLPAALKERIVALASHGGGTAAHAIPRGLDAAALHHAVDNAFVSGLHVAFWVAAAVLLSGAVVAAVFVRSGVIANVREDGDGQTPAERRPEPAIAGTGPARGPAPAPLPAEAFASHPPRSLPDERS
jgi:hypothetical protein